jgi:acetyl-CoA carboxylase biotin carboxyl carrier protein
MNSDGEGDHETQTLHELLALMHEYDLDQLKVKRGDAVYEIVRREPGIAAAPGPLTSPSAGSGPAGEPPGAAPVASPQVRKVLAPLTGLFFRAASPDAEPYVGIGDRVEAGDVLCVLEAMKLFNEIQSDYGGIVVRIIPENSELVSQGEELFWIEP